MRKILFNHARKRDAEKRGGGEIKVTLSRALEKGKIYSKDSDEDHSSKDYCTKLRLGYIYHFKAEKAANAERRTALRSAIDFYRQSEKDLKPEDTRFAELSKYMNDKIAECEAGL